VKNVEDTVRHIEMEVLGLTMALVPQGSVPLPTMLAGGGLALPNGLGTFVSSFSGRAFGATAPGPGSEWKIERLSDTSIVGTSARLQLSVRRTYSFHRLGDDEAFCVRVNVDDEFHPLGGDAGGLLGIVVNNSAVLSASSTKRVSDALIPGAFYGEARNATSTNINRGTNGNPSSLLTLDDGQAVGLMPLDTVYKAHAYVTRSADRSRISAVDPFLTLARQSASSDGTQTSPYKSNLALYIAGAFAAGMPPPPPPPGATGTSREFDFVNRLRLDLGTRNITVHGGGTMGALRADVLSLSNWTDPAHWDLDTTRAWFEFQGLYHLAANIPRLPHNWPSANCSRYTRDYCYGSCYAEHYESAATDEYNRMLTRAANSTRGGARALLYMHPFLSTEPGAWTKYAAATRVLKDDGTQLCYADCQWCCMWFGQLEVSTGAANQYGQELLKYVDRAIEADGFGGIYMDESIYSVDPRNFNPLTWDGRSGMVDPAMNGSVLQKFTDTTIVYAPMKLAVYDRIRARGGRAMANCAPVASEVVAAGAEAGAEAVVNFVETGSAINRIRWAQLYTPIALAKGLLTPGQPSDVDPKYANVTGWPVSNLFASLDFGALVFMYDHHIPNVTGWEVPGKWVNVFAHLFPMTAQLLGPGFIIGCERVVTKVSGTFAPSDDRRYCHSQEPATGAARSVAASSSSDSLFSSPTLCVRKFDNDGWQISVERRVAVPATVKLGGGEAGVFAVVVPDAGCAASIVTANAV
jgi:hypothetical protein